MRSTICRSFFFTCCLMDLLLLHYCTSHPSSAPCSLLHRKLTQYISDIRLDALRPTKFVNRPFCQDSLSSTDDSCCSPATEEKIQNATLIELHQLFEFHSIRLHEPLRRLTRLLNETIGQLIESSRNETHLVFQRDHPKFARLYRPYLDQFFDNLRQVTSKTAQYEIRTNLDELFRQMLRLAFVSDTNSRSLACLWKLQPFGSRPTQIAEQVEIHWVKLIRLSEVFQLSIELLQIITTNIKTDYHCLDLYMQLSFCNLCSDREELPCLSNCVHVMESCFVNLTLVNDVWKEFLGIFDNLTFFHSIEKTMLTLGLSLSDSLFTFWKSDQFEHRQIIDQCGQIYRQEELATNDRQFLIKYSHSLSFVDRQLSSMKESLELYRSFWLILPNQICHSQGISASIGSTCWTGTSISTDGRHIIRSTYDKPLNLRLQWILKEIREKSRSLKYLSPAVAGKTNASITNALKLNLTHNSDDYSHDQDLEYSDYAYEDPSDEITIESLTSILTTTTTLRSPSSSSSLFDDLSIDDINTVSYYDYGEQEVYSDHDDDVIETTSERVSSTVRFPIPSYHRRQPVIWNISTEDDQRNRSISFFSSSFLGIFTSLLIMMRIEMEL